MSSAGILTTDHFVSAEVDYTPAFQTELFNEIKNSSSFAPGSKLARRKWFVAGFKEVECNSYRITIVIQVYFYLADHPVHGMLFKVKEIGARLDLESSYPVWRDSALTDLAVPKAILIDKERRLTWKCFALGVWWWTRAVPFRRVSYQFLCF